MRYNNNYKSGDFCNTANTVHKAGIDETVAKRLRLFGEVAILKSVLSLDEGCFDSHMMALPLRDPCDVCMIRLTRAGRSLSGSQPSNCDVRCKDSDDSFVT